MRISKKVSQRLNGKNVLAAVVLYYGFFILFYMPFSPINEPLMGGIEMEQVLDLKKSGYDASVASKAFDSYGEAGRKIYIRNLWTLDLLFPFLSFLSSLALILYSGRKIGGFGERFSRWFLFVPVVVMSSDYLENSVLTFAVIQYPLCNPTLISVASLLTQVKWIGISVSSIGILLLLSAWVAVSLKKRVLGACGRCI